MIVVSEIVQKKFNGLYWKKDLQPGDKLVQLLEVGRSSVREESQPW